MSRPTTPAPRRPSVVSERKFGSILAVNNGASKFGSSLDVDNSVSKFGSTLDVSSCNFQDLSVIDVASAYVLMPQILACISAASFHFACGAVLGFSAILIPQLEMPDSEIKVTKTDISWIASMVALVVPVGAVVTGYLVDRIGRIRTIMVASVPMTVGWVCLALAQNLPIMLFGRSLTAFGAAMGTAPAIVYITEVAQADLRGSLISITMALTSLGMVVLYAQGAFLNWRTLSWLTIMNSLIPLVLMMLWSPESPAWLVSKGRNHDALESLKSLLKNEKKVGLAEERLAELVKEQESKRETVNQKESSFVKLCKGLMKPNGFKPLLLLTFLFSFQQFSGIYVTIFYAVTFFEDMGASINPYICAVGIGMVRLVVGLVTSLLIKTFGRRSLLLVSGSGMALFLFTAGYFTREVSLGHMEATSIPVVCILLYMTLGVTGLLTIPWTMTAEVFALEIRGMAQGLIISIAHIVMFAALKVYPFLEGILGGAYAVLWLFGGVSLTAVLFIFIFVPETHKKQLHEIQDYFKHHTVYILSKRKPKTIRIEIDEEAGEEMLKKKDVS